MKKVFSFLLIFTLVLFTHISVSKTNAAEEGVVSENTVSYKLSDSNISLSTIKGFEFDFAPAATTSYNVVITDANGNLWTTKGKVDGINGDKGSGVLSRPTASSSTPFYTNVFDNIAAGTYNIYIPFEFYTGKTAKNNKVINPVFKIDGFTDKEGVVVDSTTYTLPEEIQGTIKFVVSSNEDAIALKNAISNVKTVSDDSKYTHYQLNLDSTFLSGALSGYNELGTRGTVEFNTQSATVKWNAGTGLQTGAGFMLKMGNTGKNDIKIRFAISENGAKSPYGIDCMTESYSGEAIDENEYYTFIHMANSVKAAGTVDKVYITKRKVTIPAGYQGLLLLPFSRLRWQADGYITSDNSIYYNGRLDGILGSLRLYVDNISPDYVSTNSLTFYTMNVIKAESGTGVSYKTVGATSNGSSIAVESTTASYSPTAPSAVTTVLSTTTNGETITLATPNSGDNASKLYMNQKATFTVTGLVAGANYKAFLSYKSGENIVDISSELEVVSKSDSQLVYSYRKILQSRGAVTFTLSDCLNVKVMDGQNKIKETTVVSGSSFSIDKTELEKEHYTIKSVKVNETDVPLQEGKYTVSNITADTTIEVTYEPTKFNVTVSKDEHSAYTASSDLSISYFDTLTLTITASNGYKIKKVTINGNDATLTNNVLTLTNVTEVQTVTIESEAIEYSITVNKTGNGSFVLSKEKVSIEDSSYTLTVTPDSNSVLKSIKLNGSDIVLNNNIYEGQSIGENIIINVVFELKQYNVTLNEVQNGEVTISTSKAQHGSRVKVTVLADEGYELDKLLVNGVEAEVINGILYIENVQSDVTVEAIFKAIPKKSGCSSSISLSLASFISVLGLVLIYKKKREN